MREERSGRIDREGEKSLVARGLLGGGANVRRPKDLKKSQVV